MKLLLCFGTRPEAIKMAPVFHELKGKNIPFKICITAQHREMLDQVLKFFEIEVDYDLDLMKTGQTLNGLSAEIFRRIDEVFDDWLGPLSFDSHLGQVSASLGQVNLGLRQVQSDGLLQQAQSDGLLQQAQSDGLLRQAQSDGPLPSGQAQPEGLVLVHGDTTTASMIAQAAFHRNIKIGHVEAGLRTYNKFAPFPEEINRQIIGKLADYHFTPTKTAKKNLVREGIKVENILLTGNTVVDALEWAIQKIENNSLPEEAERIGSILDVNKKTILVTGHRRENFGKGLEEICNAIIELAGSGKYQIIYPVHLNPKVKNAVERSLNDMPNIYLVPPVNYPTMLWLMGVVDLIISDSGGIQEEAPAFGKIVLVTRKVSERMEGIEAGFSFLVGTDKEKIVQLVDDLISNPPDFKGKVNPYGDGKASMRIVEFLSSVL
ncbi:non-hydrolyzing UDP-N-acetylglucosamine 2-epimerase [Salegentibacter sp. HM20]